MQRNCKLWKKHSAGAGKLITASSFVAYIFVGSIINQLNGLQLLYTENSNKIQLNVKGFKLVHF